jgi:fibro-slime domain-containing protein
MQVDTGTFTGQTGQINQSSSSTPGFLDRCITQTKGDTVWIKAKDSLANYVGENNLVCTDHNPFFKPVGTVHVLNPWPGKTVWAQVGTTWYPLYQETGRQGWVSTSLWEDPRNPQPFRIRLANGNPTTTTGVQYMDMGGLGGSASGVPFDFTATPGKGKEVWILPPTTTGGIPKIATGAPDVAFTLYVQRPKWSSTSVRMIWQGNDSRFTPNATQFCNWYVLTFYEGAVPTKIALTNPVGDSVYGSAGLKAAPATWAAFTQWIDITIQANAGGTFNVNTDGAAPVVTGGVPTTATTCDTKVLAFSTYDYTDGVDPQYRYPPFAEQLSGVNYPSGPKAGTTTDNCPNSGGGATPGLVKPTLNAQGMPVWSGKVDCNIGQSTHGPQLWYDTLWRIGTGTYSQSFVAGATQLNHFKCLRLPLKLDAAGQYYSFESGSFFPMDTATSIPAPYRPGNNSSNFHFAMHAKAAFEYVPGLKFEFKGDDDVWIFIDKKLVLDIGGMHSAIAGTIDLDVLGLVEGRSYQFDMFYNERHTVGSSISIKTTMNLVPTLTVEFDTTKSTSGKQVVDSWVIETTSDASKCIEEGSTTVSARRAGNPSYVLVSPDGSELAFDSLYAANSLPGTFIGNNGQRFEIDTTFLKKSGKLPQSGQYQIRIDLGTESRLVLFTNVSQTTDIRGDLFDRNGDGRADSAVLRTANGTPALKTPLGAVIRWADRAGVPDSVRVGTAAIVVLPGDSIVTATFVLPERTSCPPAGCATRLGSLLTGFLGDTVVNPIISLNDRIAPVADSAWMVYDTTGTGKDTLYVLASEGLALTGGLLPVGDSAHALTGRSASSRPVPGAGILVGNLLKLPIESATNPIQPGDSIRLGGFSGDALGNAPGASSRWVPLKADPVAKSWMLDTDGDGAPDSVGIGSRGSFAAVTSARVNWKTAAGLDTSIVIATPAGVGTGLRLPAGILRNATFCVGCKLELTQGGQTRSFVLLDSVAPVALSADLRYGPSADTLVVTVSEAFTLGSAAGEGAAAVKAVGSASVPGTLVVGTPVAGTQLRIVVAPGTITADSLRLRAWILGNLSKAVGAASPYVPVRYAPQPISVTVFDRDGDGRVDSVRYSLSRSAAGAPVPSSFGLVWGGSPTTIPSLTRSLDGRSWSGPVGPLPLRTTSEPGDAGWILVGGDDSTFRAVVTDSVAPVAMQAFLIFGFEAGSPDTLRLIASEAVTAAAAGTWARLATDSNGTSGVSVGSAGAAVSVVGGTTIQMVVASGTIPNGMAWARLGQAISDSKGNAVGTSSRWVRLRVSPSGRAWLLDSDGDGHADSMHVSVRGSLSAARAVLGWQTSAGLPDTRTWLASPSTGAFGLKAGSPLERFGFGATSCTGCMVAFVDPAGDTLALWPLADSVAPIATGGLYRFGTTFDTLIATFSEPLASINPAAPWLEWGGPALGGAVGQTSATTAGKTATFLVPAASGAVDGWDSIRLAVGPRSGAVSDLGGTKVGAASPWAPLTYGIVPLRAWLTDPAGLGRGTHVRVEAARTVPARAAASLASFVFTWTNADGSALETRPVAASALVYTAPGTWTGALSVPFALGRTSCLGGCTATGASASGETGSAILQDSIAPSAVRARLRYSPAEVALDTVILDLSEPWIGGDPSDLVGVIASVGRTDASRDLLPMRAWFVGNGTVLSIVVPTEVSSRIARGDSMRLAWIASGSRVFDAAGIRVGANSRWVPVEFGLRPPLFVVEPYRGLLRNGGTTGQGTWVAPPASYPTIEVLERRPDGSLVKVDASGGGMIGGPSINDTARTIGVDIRINRPLEGALIIYDNIGTAVGSQDLGVLKALWEDQPDAERTIRIQWNVTGPPGKFAASGVYLFRVMARYQDDEGNVGFYNNVWKLGFRNDGK